MAIIQKVTLCDIEIIERDGEFEATQINKRIVPAMLTNYAIEVGHRMGLLKGSLNADLFGVMAAYVKHGGSLEPLADGTYPDVPIEAIESISGLLDDSKVMAVIYIACIGANPRIDLTYDDFVKQYNVDPQERLQTYFNLISNLQASDKAAFAKEFKGKTSNSRDSKKK